MLLSSVFHVVSILIYLITISKIRFAQGWLKNDHAHFRDNVEWDEEQEEVALKKILENSSVVVEQDAQGKQR